MTKTVTVDEFLDFNPCYSEDAIRDIAGDKEEWSALDILALENIPANDRLWAVLREELIGVSLIQEFACRCAEAALSLVNNPDERIGAAIATKRAWLRGEATHEQLTEARNAAHRYAYEHSDICNINRAGKNAAKAAAHVANTTAIKIYSLLSIAAATNTYVTDGDEEAALAAAENAQVEMLIKLLKEAE